MQEYSIQEEATRILREKLLDDANIGLHPAIIEAADHVSIVGADSKPFVPTPCKLTESASSLIALVGSAASAISSDRYGVPLQKVTVDTDMSTLFIMSIALPTVNGKNFLQNDQIASEIAKTDLYESIKPIHRATTNLYRTADNKWYHLHGSMNASTTMAMLGIPEQDGLTHEEARALVAARVAQHTAAELEAQANDTLRQAGVTCQTPAEFFSSAHGAAVAPEPLWNRRPVALAAPVPWPPAANPAELRPLAGIRVVDFSRVVAAPVVSKLLALLGATVVKVSCTALPEIGMLLPDLSTGKRDADINLKTDEGRAAFELLVQGADVLVDGFRPGVLDRLGFPLERLRALSPGLVVARENCYGWTGPLKERSGWQQISDSLVGIAWLQGQFMGLDEPIMPLLPNSDYQTGLIGAAAVLEALLIRARQPLTFTVDMSLTQYNIWYYRLGQYSAEQQAALRARNEGFALRYYEDMFALLQKMHRQLLKVRPDMFSRPEFFEKMSGVEWGLTEDDEMRILAPPLEMDKSKLGYDTPSGSRGRSKAEW